MFSNQTLVGQDAAISASTQVLRKTYLLLSFTLIFSACTAALAMFRQTLPMNPFIFIIGYFGLLYLTSSLRHSKLGIVSIFALTGFMGYTLGPILNFYLHAFSNGNQIVFTAFGATGIIFFALSAYALISKKDFSYLAAFLTVGLTIAFVGVIASLFLNIPMLDLFVSCAFVLLSSGLILFETSRIIHGGQDNYIMATITLYVSLFNLFISLLRILSAFSGRR